MDGDKMLRGLNWENKKKKLNLYSYVLNRNKPCYKIKKKHPYKLNTNIKSQVFIIIFFPGLTKNIHIYAFDNAHSVCDLFLWKVYGCMSIRTMDIWFFFYFAATIIKKFVAIFGFQLTISVV